MCLAVKRERPRREHVNWTQQSRVKLSGTESRKACSWVLLLIWHTKCSVKEKREQKSPIKATTQSHSPKPASSSPFITNQWCHKLLFLFLNDQERRHPTLKHPFMNYPGGFKYLVMTISPKFLTFIPTNYEPIITQIQDNISRLSFFC